MKPFEIKVKRVYDQPAEDDGLRVMVDRIWPRGIKKEDLKIDLWLKDLAPSETLRKWFGHDPERWDEFRSHYFEEMHEKLHILEELVYELNRTGFDTVTLLYSAREEKYNNAVALKEFLQNEGIGRKLAA